VVDRYLALIMKRSVTNKSIRVNVLSTSVFLFFTKNCDSLDIKERCVGVGGQSQDLLLCPICWDGHWTLLVFDFRNCSISHLNSGNRFGNVLWRDFVDVLVQSVLPLAVDWPPLSKDVLQQVGGTDCGVYMCLFAEAVSRDVEPCFEHDQIHFSRQIMAYELHIGELVCDRFLS